MSTQPTRLELRAGADSPGTMGREGIGAAPPPRPATPYDFSRKYWAFAVPAVVAILAVIVFPWLFTLYMSTQDWKIGGGAAFIGLIELRHPLPGRALPRVGRANLLVHLARRRPPVILGTAAAVAFHREFPFRGLCAASSPCR